MENENNKYYRRSIRLKEFDYASPWWYYVTICTHERRCLFGRIQNGQMYLNELGEIVEKGWMNTKNIRPNVELDEFIIMPNHLHGIIIIERGVLQYAPTDEIKFHSPSQSLGAIVRGFKSSVTKQINELRQTPSQPVWQRNYYEHIIRNQKDLERIRHYIHFNVSKWQGDENHFEE